MKRPGAMWKGIGAYLAALVAMLFFLAPVYFMITAAFKSDAELAQLPPSFFPLDPTLEHFHEFFFEFDGFLAAKNSLIIVGLSSCLSMIFGSLAAYALARFQIKGKEVLALEILSVRMLPPIVSAIPLFLLAKKLNLFDTHLLLIMIYTLSGLPFVVWIMRVFVHDVPLSVEEAALIDGCNRFQVLYHITLPLLLPGLAATLVIIVMFSWNEFLFASLLTSSTAKTLPVVAAQALKPKAIAWGLASAAGVIMSLPVVVLALLLQRYLVRGLTFGAVKG